MTLPVAILAGGLATRLRPITISTPKVLVDVAGKPFIIRTLDHLRANGIASVVLCIGHLGEQVRAIVGDGSQFGIDVRYSSDGAELVGTGGALRQALPLLGPEFFVLYGDSYLPIDFRPVERAFASSGKSALMTVLRNENQWDQSNVEFHDGHLIEYNKRTPRAAMHHIDYGLSVLSARALASVPAAVPFDLSDTYHYLSREGQLAGHEVFERFYEIGSHDGLEETVRHFQRSNS